MKEKLWKSLISLWKEDQHCLDQINCSDVPKWQKLGMRNDLSKQVVKGDAFPCFGEFYKRRHIWKVKLYTYMKIAERAFTHLFPITSKYRFTYQSVPVVKCCIFPSVQILQTSYFASDYPDETVCSNLICMQEQRNCSIYTRTVQWAQNNQSSALSTENFSP